jgi:hypothetical protein
MNRQVELLLRLEEIERKRLGRDEKQALIQEIEKELHDEDLLRRFRARQSRSGSAIAAILDNVCLGCGMHYPDTHQVIQKLETEVVWCEFCGRIVYPAPESLRARILAESRKPFVPAQRPVPRPAPQAPPPSPPPAAPAGLPIPETSSTKREARTKKPPVKKPPEKKPEAPKKTPSKKKAAAKAPGAKVSRKKTVGSTARKSAARGTTKRSGRVSAPSSKSRGSGKAAKASAKKHARAGRSPKPKKKSAPRR